MATDDWLMEKRQRDVAWMTDDQWDCYLFAAEFFGGFHHMIDKPKPCGNDGIKLSEHFNWLATHDAHSLTHLVFMAHDRCIRAEIMPSGPGLLGLVLHKRHSRDGESHTGHPTLEQALASWRRVHPQPSVPTSSGCTAKAPS